LGISAKTGCSPQMRVAQYLHEYIQNLQDEIKWDNSFQKTQNKLVAAAQKAKQEIARGLSQPMDYDKL
jgi:hypothetical protein